MSTCPTFRLKSLTGIILLTCITGCASSRFGCKSDCARIEISDVHCNQCESCPDANCGCAKTAVIPEEKSMPEISSDVAPPSPLLVDNHATNTPEKTAASIGQSIATPSTGNIFSRMGQNFSNIMNKNKPVQQKVYKEATQAPKYSTPINRNEFNMEEEQVEEFPIANPETSLPPMPENEINNKIARKNVPKEMWNPLVGFSQETDTKYNGSGSVIKEQDVETWPYQINAQPVLHSQKTVLGIRKISQEVHANKPIMIVPQTVE
jgi:hypothetical protein